MKKIHSFHFYKFLMQHFTIQIRFVFLILTVYEYIDFA